MDVKQHAIISLTGRNTNVVDSEWADYSRASCCTNCNPYNALSSQALTLQLIFYRCLVLVALSCQYPTIIEKILL